MTHDPRIKAALRKAAVAIAEIPPLRNRDQAAAGIAVFLRDPYANACELTVGGTILATADLNDLADAVEAIARDA